LNVVATAILLIVTLLAVPLLSYFFGTPLGPLEWAALKTLGAIVLVAWAFCFVVGELSGNVSQVDRLWSLLPVVYAWVVAAYGDFSTRLLLMALLVTAWGARLTFNFARQGGYRLKFWSGHEDYRWDVLRRRPEFRARWKWTLFNGLFISGYQNLLILLFTLPTLVALQFRDTPLGWLDAAAAAAMLLLIGMEAVADHQQWRFQSAKKAQAGCGKPLPAALAKGFVDTGLWARCRHPNYFAEQGVWIAFYFFSVAASGQWINWSISGALLLVILFQGSSAFSEEISAAKYPAYPEYQRSVPRFLPLGRKRPPAS
jgi:steroid 5-alpha reductase family enzyme